MKPGAAICIAVLLAASMGIALPASAGHIDDGGCNGDAADSFDDATAFCGEPEVNCTDDDEPFSASHDRPYVCYPASLHGSDTDDHYRIPLDARDDLVVDIYDASALLQIRLLDPDGVVVDDGTGSELITTSTSLNPLGTNIKRVEVESARVTGDYRLHVSEAPFFAQGDYKICVRPCEGPVGQQPNEFTAGPIRDPSPTEVLLIPPSHGDLGNPDGPTAADYLNETLQGLHDWEWALDAFAQDHPEYSYLENISVEVDLFDGPGATPIDPAGYDVVLGYVASGPTFRGVAISGLGNAQFLLEDLGLGDDAKWEGRYIALSLYAASPRAGQAVEDFPEPNDLHAVTFHEFAHTWGIGHTLTWTGTHGPDLMNSPASFVYGDGDPAGDGGERTPRECISSLNLYAMAVTYDWMEDGGDWEPIGPSSVTLPSDIDYEMYCPPQESPGGVLDAVPGAKREVPTPPT